MDHIDRVRAPLRSSSSRSSTQVGARSSAEPSRDAAPLPRFFARVRSDGEANMSRGLRDRIYLGVPHHGLGTVASTRILPRIVDFVGSAEPQASPPSRFGICKSSLRNSTRRRSSRRPSRPEGDDHHSAISESSPMHYDILSSRGIAGFCMLQPPDNTL